LNSRALSATKEASAAPWMTLATERIEDTSPTIPLGSRFWSLSKLEKQEIGGLFADEEMRELATIL
jgi:hypothetical protein